MTECMADRHRMSSSKAWMTLPCPERCAPQVDHKLAQKPDLNATTRTILMDFGQAASLGAVLERYASMLDKRPQDLYGVSAESAAPSLISLLRLPPACPSPLRASPESPQATSILT